MTEPSDAALPAPTADAATNATADATTAPSTPAPAAATGAPAKTHLTDPLPLPCGATVPNRLAKAAMSEQLGDRANRPTAELANLYARWGNGGCGLVITGNVMIDRDHLGEPRNVVVDDRRDLDLLKRWADRGRSGGANIWVQLNHPGRQGLRMASNQQPVAPSAIAAAIPTATRPRALEPSEIEAIVKRFATSAAVIKEAGFDGVQLHGAHGYLISQFLSPRANVRTDGWGGDAERRRRFPLEVLKATRAAVGPDFPVGIKLNSADFQRGGFTEEESADVIAALAEAGIDLIEISGGTYESPAMMGTVRESTREREAYFLAYAESVRDRAPGVPLMVTGGFRTQAAMAAAVAEGACDAVGLGRPLALYPDGGSGLLDGTRERIEAGSPRVGIRMLDSAVDLYWHTRQLQRVANGKAPKPGEGGARTLAALLVDNGWGSLRRQRGG